MRIMNLTGATSTVYTSNAYLVLGDWSGLQDVNTLVDAGNDPALVERLAVAPTGVGKRAVEQVILTHGHFDHTSQLAVLKELYHPVVYGHPACAAAEVALRDGQVMRCGDRPFEVIYTPGHSQDSICLYCAAEGVLFAGDAPLVIRSEEGSYEDRFIEVLERLCRLDVEAIYFGHGDPVTAGAHALLTESLRRAKSAQLARGR